MRLARSSPLSCSIDAYFCEPENITCLQLGKKALASKIPSRYVVDAIAEVYPVEPPPQTNGRTIFATEQGSQPYPESACFW